jgi:hypothetical protein
MMLLLAVDLLTPGSPERHPQQLRQNLTLLPMLLAILLVLSKKNKKKVQMMMAGEGFAKGYAKGRDYSLRPGKPSKQRADDPGTSSGEGTWPDRMWDEMDSGLPEVLPSELLGWLMLRRCKLAPRQRLNILSSVGNSLRADMWNLAYEVLKTSSDFMNKIVEEKAKATIEFQAEPTFGSSVMENGAC